MHQSLQNKTQKLGLNHWNKVKAESEHEIQRKYIENYTIQAKKVCKKLLYYYFIHF